MSKNKKTDIGIETAYKELNSIVTEFENGQVDLETSITMFKRGLELATFLKSKLKKMENEVLEIKAKFDEMEHEKVEEEEINLTEDQKGLF